MAQGICEALPHEGRFETPSAADSCFTHSTRILEHVLRPGCNRTGDVLPGGATL